MSRFKKALSVFAVSLLGLWGCAQGPIDSTAEADRVKALETKCTGLEETYRTTAIARDQALKQVAGLKQDKAQLEEQRAQMQKEIEQYKIVAKERDRLRQEVEIKTAQRDVLQGRCDRIKAGIRSLMSEDDAMLNTPAPTTTTVSNAGGQ